MAQIRQAAEQNARMEKAEEGTVLKKAISPLSTSKVPLTEKLLKAVKGKLIRWKSVPRALSPGSKTSLKGTKREMT